MVSYRLAVSGKANAGKNTVAEMLVQCLKQENSKDKIVALADPMKHIVKTMCPEAKIECLWGPSSLRAEIISEKYRDAAGNLLTYRQALLDIGAYGRKYNNNIWLNCLVEDAKQSTDVGTYIVSDVRFLNEFYYLKQAGFITIRVLRNDSAHINDVSEYEQEKIQDSEFHYVIHNNGSLDDLDQEIKMLVHKLNGLM